MTALTTLTVLGAVVAGTIAIRFAVWHITARAVQHRLGRPGADGVVAGAESILLEGPGPVAVLALHGFGDTPQSLAYLATALHARGWTVHVPLLPGHGRSLSALAVSRSEDWERASHEALQPLLASGKRVVVVGQSMGAALAALLAAGEPQIVACVWLAPLLSTTPAMERGARLWWMIGFLRPVVDTRDPRSILDPVERARAIGYGVLPVRLAPEIVRLVHRAFNALPRVHVPTLVLQSRDDNRVTAAGTETALAMLGTTDRALHWVTGAGHVLAVDFGHEALSAQVGEWIGRHGTVAPLVHAV